MARMTHSEQPPRPVRHAPRPERQAAFRFGISAESRAAAFLIAKGFRILARRWRSPLGEIDIVARRRQLLVFAEVKARGTLHEAAESVNERQRWRIAAAAEVWLAANPDESIPRYPFRCNPGGTGENSAAHPGRVRDMTP